MPRDTNTHEVRRRGHHLRRRDFVHGAAGTALLLLAGCIGGGDDGNGDGDDRSERDDEIEGKAADLEFVDQEFRVRTHRNPDSFNYFLIDKSSNFLWDRLLTEPGAWGQWSHVVYQDVGDLNYGLYEDVVLEDDRLEITVREDARWSDGEPVLGKDAIVGPIEKRLEEASPTFEDVEEEGPNYTWEAITDFEYDGKTGILYSDGDYFGDLHGRTVWRQLLVEHGPRYNSRLRPYDDFVEAIFEVMTLAADGELDPWEADGPTTTHDIRDDLFGTTTDYWEEYFRDPEHVHTNGAWTLEEIRGDTEIVLAPNEYHRNVDLINFDSIVIESIGSEDAVWASLESGRLDLTGTEPPPHVANQFPSRYEQHVAPSLTGRALELNHGYDDHIGNPRIRQALLAVIDAVEICEAINPTLYEPITMPSGDNRGLPPVATDEWIEENLMEYRQNYDLATDLLESIDCERNSEGYWEDEEGVEIEAPIFTNANTPEEERIIEQQFEAFGFRSEVVTLENALFADGQDMGELAMWPQSGNSGYAYYAIAGEIAGAGGYRYAHHHYNVMRRHGFFDGSVEEQLEQTEWDDDGWPATHSPSALEHLTITAPPIGEFWADPADWKQWPVLSMTYRLDTAVGDEREQLWKDLLWLNNWHLPGLPYANLNRQSFINTENWHWPTDHEAWEYLGITSNIGLESLLGWGDQVFADPDNPK